VEGPVEAADGSGIDAATAEALLSRLLGATYLVNDRDAATLLAAGPMPGARFVTRDGAIIEPDGRLTAGPEGAGEEGAGVLARRAELAELNKQIEALDTELADARARLEAVDAEASALQKRLGEIEAQIAAAERTGLA